MDQNFLRAKMFLVPNIFEPKFLLDLSYASHNIHVQNTFLADSKQIQKILENNFVPKIFGPKFLLALCYFGSEFFFGTGGQGEWGGGG